MEKSNLFFIIIWIVIGIPTFILFQGDILFGGSIDSARYMLSALAQAQAAIVAIVVSLTLVVVQLASQTYSPRTIRLFMKEKAFWTLLLLYGISIFYDLTLLNMLSNENFKNLGIFINMSIFLGIVAFSALFPYTKETLEKIK
ncbi:MAG: DUF2254 family protein, partial [Elusimicrobiota bacterium]|nr:DUF2254 family protein [Elusimicrobiota bacterium]